MTVLPALVFWILAHGLVERWRRLPPPVTYAALFAAMAVTGGALWWIRQPLLATELGWSFWLLLPASILYAAGIAVEKGCRKHLALRTLVGVPELVEGAAGPGLLQEGIYGRVRHPRYLGASLGMLGVAFFTNYLAIWLLLPLFLAGLFLVTVLEERELERRFGEAYADYRRRVPRLWPRI